MQCPQCQQENPEGARFCNGCGANLEATCPQCGQTSPPGSRFCNGCGARLTGTAAPAPAAPPSTPSPHTYTPQHLAERIISSRGALEGERKQVTVLFADLKGSMELLADRDPEDARRILDPVLERMMEAVHRYEGTVNQVMGDGIMALFGAPLAHEDHAVRACYAALRMEEAVKAYAQEVQRTHGLPLHIRVGLNSGEVVVRSISSDLRMDYTAVGQTTHLAARMEQMAMPGSILLAPDTLGLVEGYVQVKALGPMQVKGLNDAVEVSVHLPHLESQHEASQEACRHGPYFVPTAISDSPGSSQPFGPSKRCSSRSISCQAWSSCVSVSRNISSPVWTDSSCMWRSASAADAKCRPVGVRCTATARRPAAWKNSPRYAGSPSENCHGVPGAGWGRLPMRRAVR